ncbi:MAG: chaperonin GroEL, partial [Phycisphaerae bacterium]|nr:chaperonin GroEL [Phycisphaerae bacterium]
ELPEPFKNMGAKMVNEVASKTSDLVGDGTTTATVLAEAIYNEGLKRVSAGVNPVAVQRGINNAAQVVVEYIESVSKKVKGHSDIAKVGAISANNNPEVGEILAEAMDKVGTEGVIEIEEGNGLETELTVVEGMQFDKGYLSPYFMTNPNTMEAVLEDAYILLHEQKISNVREIVPLLEKIAQTGSQLLIVAEEVEGEALAALVINRLQGVLKVCTVKAPGFGDRRKAMMEDLAVLTGGQVITEDLGIKLETVELTQLGKAKRIVVSKDNTTIIEGAGTKKAIKSRCEQIKNFIEKTTSEYDKEKLRERLAKLTGGVAVIKAGAPTETEMKERKDLLDDALHATKAAVEEGVVAGGGVTYLRAIASVNKAKAKAKGDEKVGFDIIADALKAPTRQIVDNGGEEGDVIVAQLLEKEGNIGYDAGKGEFVDMLKAGIIDPAKVARIALQNAASVAGLMLTTNVIISDLKDDDPENATVGAVI